MQCLPLYSTRKQGDDTILNCNNLAIGHEGHVVVEGLNFSVEAGDYLCIIGANGAGKSTLMKTLLGLIPPISGEMSLTYPKELGYLPQQTARQKDFPATVNEIVLSGCLSGPFYNKTHKKRALDAMERLGLVPLAKRSYRELSGGQQERVLLARALCTSGKMLLLDEPTAGLDPKITAELYELLSNLHQEGITLVMISHDMDAALRYATKILWLNENIFYGTKEEYLKKFPQ